MSAVTMAQQSQKQPQAKHQHLHKLQQQLQQHRQQQLREENIQMWNEMFLNGCNIPIVGQQHRYQHQNQHQNQHKQRQPPQSSPQSPQPQNLKNESDSDSCECNITSATAASTPAAITTTTPPSVRWPLALRNERPQVLGALSAVGTGTAGCAPSRRTDLMTFNKPYHNHHKHQHQHHHHQTQLHQRQRHHNDIEHRRYREHEHFGGGQRCAATATVATKASLTKLKNKFKCHAEDPRQHAQATTTTIITATATRAATAERQVVQMGVEVDVGENSSRPAASSGCRRETVVQCGRSLAGRGGGDVVDHLINFKINCKRQKRVSPMDYYCNIQHQQHQQSELSDQHKCNNHKAAVTTHNPCRFVRGKKQQDKAMCTRLSQHVDSIHTTTTASNRERQQQQHNGLCKLPQLCLIFVLSIALLAAPLPVDGQQMPPSPSTTTTTTTPTTTPVTAAATTKTTTSARTGAATRHTQSQEQLQQRKRIALSHAAEVEASAATSAINGGASANAAADFDHEDRRMTHMREEAAAERKPVKSQGAHQQPQQQREMKMERMEEEEALLITTVKKVVNDNEDDDDDNDDAQKNADDFARVGITQAKAHSLIVLNDHTNDHNHSLSSHKPNSRKNNNNHNKNNKSKSQSGSSGGDDEIDNDDDDADNSHSHSDNERYRQGSPARTQTQSSEPVQRSAAATVTATPTATAEARAELETVGVTVTEAAEAGAELVVEKVEVEAAEAGKALNPSNNNKTISFINTRRSPKRLRRMAKNNNRRIMKIMNMTTAEEHVATAAAAENINTATEKKNNINHKNKNHMSGALDAEGDGDRNVLPDRGDSEIDARRQYRYHHGPGVEDVSDFLHAVNNDNNVVDIDIAFGHADVDDHYHERDRDHDRDGGGDGDGDHDADDDDHELDLIDEDNVEPNRFTDSDSEDNRKLMKLVMNGLGLQRLPDMEKVNISQHEYASKYREYLRRVHERKRRELFDLSYPLNQVEEVEVEVEPDEVEASAMGAMVDSGDHSPLHLLSIVTNSGATPQSLPLALPPAVLPRRGERHKRDMQLHADQTAAIGNDSDDDSFAVVAGANFSRRQTRSRSSSGEKARSRAKLKILLHFPLSADATQLRPDDVEEANIRLMLIHSPALAMRPHGRHHSRPRHQQCADRPPAAPQPPPAPKRHVLNLKVYQLLGHGKRQWLDGLKVEIEVDRQRADETHSQWLQFDVTKAVEAWLGGARRDNLGLEVQCDNCQRIGARILNEAAGPTAANGTTAADFEDRDGDGDSDSSSSEAPEAVDASAQLMPVLNIIGRLEKRTQRHYAAAGVPHHHTTTGGVGGKRQPPQKKTCFKANQRCCRHTMEVVFKEIKGFEFIIQPKVFDAGYCHGRCPPRYNPAHHHAMLQSLIWKQSRQRAPRPCCAPSKLVELEVLHVDEKDSEKLKISTWTDMRVVECACS